MLIFFYFTALSLRLYPIFDPFQSVDRWWGDKFLFYVGSSLCYCTTNRLSRHSHGRAARWSLGKDFSAYSPDFESWLSANAAAAQRCSSPTVWQQFSSNQAHELYWDDCSDYLWVRRAFPVGSARFWAALMWSLMMRGLRLPFPKCLELVAVWSQLAESWPCHRSTMCEFSKARMSWCVKKREREVEN